ncbi:MAG: virulence factor [Verrucomicrobiota bacterium]
MKLQVNSEHSVQAAKIDSRSRLPHAPRMFAIAFDLDTETLSQTYGLPSYNNAYADIKRFLQAKGFDWQQGSVYFGGASIDAVKCVLAVQELSRNFPWFAASVRDIRMLRIEDNNDLKPALDLGS